MSSPSVDKSEYDTGLAEDDDDDDDANFVNAVLFPCIVPESCCLRLRAVIDEDEDESDDEWGTSIPTSSSSSSSSSSSLRRDFRDRRGGNWPLLSAITLNCAQTLV